MKSIYLFLFISLGLLSGCAFNEINQQTEQADAEIQKYIKVRNLTMQKTADGMYFLKDTKGSTGKTASTSDLIKFHYKMTLLDGSLIDSTNRVLNQFKAEVWGTKATIFTLPLSNLKEGESGVFILPASLAFGGSSFGNVPSYSTIRVDITVIAIRTEAEQIADMKVTYGMENAELTTSGMFFKKLVEKPSAAQVLVGQNVVVSYVGKFGYGVLQQDSAGKWFYSPTFGSGTIGSASSAYYAGSGNLIAGFEEAVMKLRIGEKASIILPYKLAYGTAGNTAIPGYSPLYFEIEIISAQ
ncbi:FKBP-type peptidyl-prolyl cis-trans isomerase [Aquirufa echingensis]|uniref:Peptidyl-prolyl cis-trans isomerase n=1 Tax=Aquirufa echingensis TaxID=3096516 RepID=A0ABW6CZT2_9BACT